MKKMILATLTIMVAGKTMAQLNVGGKAGLNYSIYGTKIDPEPEEKPESSTGVGFHVGAYLDYMFSDNIGLRTELLYSARGTSETETTTDELVLFGTTITTKTESDVKNTISYVELPVLLNYKASDNLSFLVGPGLGFLMSNKSKFDATITTTTTAAGEDPVTNSSSLSGDSDSKEGLRGMEIGGVLGVVYELESGLNFGLRYWRGINTLNEETDFGPATVKTNSNVIQFSVGYTFIKN
jgi:hypothetical protein